MCASQWVLNKPRGGRNESTGRRRSGSAFRDLPFPSRAGRNSGGGDPPDPPRSTCGSGGLSAQPRWDPESGVNYNLPDRTRPDETLVEVP
ncbi:hypothetical protein JTE90_023593 [Oedothorax gibbosus]|uniref:Uncharacterized protein n=1 Tax=Oedothorax gibbosus TaxID=931172 RepID=A0AAV6TFG1_9ARAC|nr:hypothetical protein JTE90_023593 [Oedothorax gibbosus]